MFQQQLSQYRPLFLVQEAIEENVFEKDYSAEERNEIIHLIK